LKIGPQYYSAPSRHPVVHAAYLLPPLFVAAMAALSHRVYHLWPEQKWIITIQWPTNFNGIGQCVAE